METLIQQNFPEDTLSYLNYDDPLPKPWPIGTWEFKGFEGYTPYSDINGVAATFSLSIFCGSLWTDFSVYPFELWPGEPGSISLGIWTGPASDAPGTLKSATYSIQLGNQITSIKFENKFADNYTEKIASINTYDGNTGINVKYDDIVFYENTVMYFECIRSELNRFSYDVFFGGNLICTFQGFFGYGANVFFSGTIQYGNLSMSTTRLRSLSVLGVRPEPPDPEPPDPESPSVFWTDLVNCHEVTT